MTQTTFTIGQLAQRLGLNAPAIRYYERVGVLPEPARESGQRRHDAEAVKRVERLQTAKQAGFTLQEARLLLQAARPATRCTSRCASSQRASCPKSRRSSPGPRACARGCWQPPAAHAKPSMRVRW
jgi:MerR family redox-sensitive transcriptional activator SoxR